jgi:AbiTii
MMKRYPTKMIAELSKSNGTQIAEAGCVLQRSSFVRILDAVRNLVLDWAIGLERAGVTGDGISFTPEEQRQAHTASSVINVGPIGSMTGNIGIDIASGDIINAPVNVEKVRNLVSQVRSSASALTNEGVDGEALTAAIKAIEQQLSAEHPTLLRHALSELEKVVMKASGSLIAQGVLAVLHQILGTGIPGV